MKTLMTSLIMALLISLLAVGAFAQTDENPASDPGGDPAQDPTTIREDEFVDNDGSNTATDPTLERNGPPEGDDPIPMSELDPVVLTQGEIDLDGLAETLKAFDFADGLLAGDLEHRTLGPGFDNDMTRIGPPMFADGDVGFGAANIKDKDVE